MKNIRKILLIGFPVLLIIIGIVYVLLGGLKQPEITITSSDGYIILGKRFSGKLDDKNLKETYREAQKKFKEGELKGIFSVMHFHEPDAETGKVDAVIGVVVKDSLQKKPKGYEYFHWGKGPVAKADIRSHFSVAPSPETINEVVTNLAQSKGYKLDSGSLERYFESDHLEVEFSLISIK